MEHEEEPNTTMARTQYEFAREHALVGELWYGHSWDELTDPERNLWERMAAVSHEAYHKAYEAREQTMPAIAGRHRAG
jgi:hypothetical protein